MRPSNIIQLVLLLKHNECDNILTSKELFYRSHLRHFIDHGYLKLELIEPGVQYIDA